MATKSPISVICGYSADRVSAVHAVDIEYADYYGRSSSVITGQGAMMTAWIVILHLSRLETSDKLIEESKHQISKHSCTKESNKPSKNRGFTRRAARRNLLDSICKILTFVRNFEGNPSAYGDSAPSAPTLTQTCVSLYQGAQGVCPIVGHAACILNDWQ
ncbi:uncharacterized protein SETTUDRAFT_34552 [Exserohilum turcica Et28A]|uniref:Uncharacterized protein n=1 Tax=Exserohilum turcicum (strain 28A) TaxID=671987 RepID=R0ICY0_EXST2|nr:uncharacterized protein SETTUDRAFT_34552 [Exserohilum turcica Et28A]EOA83041.1 hypothetical protein SETTUDRAFT_34552 [Exserohilum turcica Et28A]